MTTSQETPRTFYVKQGDRLPDLVVTIYDENDALIDPTLFDEIKLYIAPIVGGRRIVDGGVMTVYGTLDEGGKQEGDDIGKVVYEWVAGETDLPGEYLMEIVLSIQDESFNMRSRTVPRSTYDKLIITARL